MSRDYRNLKVFALAANIVEGSVRHSTREWLNFLNIAGGSATEAGYLARVAGRLGCIGEPEAIALERRASKLAASLRAMSRWLREKAASPTQRPEAKGASRQRANDRA